MNKVPNLIVSNMHYYAQLHKSHADVTGSYFILTRHAAYTNTDITHGSRHCTLTNRITASSHETLVAMIIMQDTKRQIGGGGGGQEIDNVQRVLCIATRERQVEKCATQKKGKSTNTIRNT